MTLRVFDIRSDWQRVEDGARELVGISIRYRRGLWVRWPGAANDNGKPWGHS